MDAIRKRRTPRRVYGCSAQPAWLIIAFQVVFRLPPLDTSANIASLSTAEPSKDAFARAKEQRMMTRLPPLAIFIVGSSLPAAAHPAIHRRMIFSRV
jgi:hypothetical protein